MQAEAAMVSSHCIKKPAHVCCTSHHCINSYEQRLLMLKSVARALS
jgi:hypothetical protein